MGNDRSRIAEKLVGKLAEQYGVDAGELLNTLLGTAFHQGWKDGKEVEPLNDDELAAALTMCQRYDLDPFAKEIYVMRNRGKLLIIVPIDGWVKICNREARYDGCQFEDRYDESGKLLAITCRIKIKGREWPTEVTEMLAECRGESIPWKTHPHRMLQWKAFIQCARVSFGVSGIMDDDEAAGILSGEAILVTERPKGLPAPEAIPEYLGRNLERERELRRDMESEEVPPAEERAAVPPPPPAAPSRREPGRSPAEEHKELMATYVSLRRGFSAQQLHKVAQISGVPFVNGSCTVEDMRKVVAAAEEVAAG